MEKIPDQSVKLSELNRTILHIKKKIQLSEGQRKALFEDCEAERKSNFEESEKLKKEIRDLVKKLAAIRRPSSKLIAFDKRVENIIGPCENKSGKYICELVDLQCIDKTKQFDLLRFKTNKKKKYLAELSKEYQHLIGEFDRKRLLETVEKPNKKTISELQNSIHAISVQLREANHIKNRYSDIKAALKADSDRFESNITKLQEELHAQSIDTAKLQKIMQQAALLRSRARAQLHAEEKLVQSQSDKRSRESHEAHRLVAERKTELERLERRLFQSNKLVAGLRPDPEGAEDPTHTDDEKSPTPRHPFDVLTEHFEVLKKSTGATNAHEVLERFTAQRETLHRLTELRLATESEKRNLEERLDELKTKLDGYKYAEEKDVEVKTTEMTRILTEIESNQAGCLRFCTEKAEADKAVQTISSGLLRLFLCINPLGVPTSDPLQTLDLIEFDLKSLMEKKSSHSGSLNENLKLEVLDDKWLPPPYNGIVRRTPIPQPGVSPAPPAPPDSEEEDEVPSRGYLKRQAQLVIDAKSRRKTLRVQVPKRN